jgi:RNA polymerase sigma-70 factor (ECF subfamily)
MNGSSSLRARASADSVEHILALARSGDQERLGKLLEQYRNYLTILAATQLDARLRRRFSPSDLVQEAMLGATRDFAQFRGLTERELLAWLRQILIHCLHHAHEAHIRAGRRDVRREISLDEMALDRSAAKLADVLAVDGSSPAAKAAKREKAVEVADLLARLRPDYRDVIVLRNLQGLSFEEIALAMDRKPGAVRMLWLRAIEKFKRLGEADVEIS